MHVVAQLQSPTFAAGEAAAGSRVFIPSYSRGIKSLVDVYSDPTQQLSFQCYFHLPLFTHSLVFCRQVHWPAVNNSLLTFLQFPFSFSFSLGNYKITIHNLMTNYSIAIISSFALTMIKSWLQGGRKVTICYLEKKRKRKPISWS